MISAIVCVDENWGIGSNGDLLVHIPEDMKFFKEKTSNSVVIMGRKTFDSINNKPLPNRINGVITSKVDFLEYVSEENYYLMSMHYVKDYILSLFAKHDYIDVFVIGGSTIYEELLPYCDNVYMTKVFHGYDNADTYFPNIDNMPEWEMESASEIKECNNIKYQFFKYRKY